MKKFYNLEAYSAYYNYGAFSIFIKVLSVNKNDVDLYEMA